MKLEDVAATTSDVPRLDMANTDVTVGLQSKLLMIIVVQFCESEGPISIFAHQRRVNDQPLFNS